MSAAAVLLLLLPWLRVDPPPGLSWSNAPYTDEGFYNAAARNLVMFGSFGHEGLFGQLTNGGYAVANAVVFSVTGPSIDAARMVSVLSVCAMVLLAVWGLSGVVGFPAAMVVAAGIGGSQLLLLYGHIAIVEPFESAWLFAAFVVGTRGFVSGRWPLGILGGVFLAVAAAAKASAFLAFPAVIGLPMVVALATRAWRRLMVALASAGTVVVLAGIWVLVVALPNRADLSASLKTLNGTNLSTYPHGLGAALSRLTRWVSHPGATDHVIPWSRPLLAAAAAGIVGCGLLWRRARPAHLFVAASGLVWVTCCWAVPILSGYSPNRYFLIGIPGLGLVAGPGLGLAAEWATGRLRGRAWRPAAGAALALLVALPGVVSYLRLEYGLHGRDQLAADQAAVARVLPKNAVLFGLYGPEMAFSAPVRLVVPWPQSSLHMRSPVQRFRVNYVIADISPSGRSTGPVILRAVSTPGRPLGPPLVTVPWGPHRLAVYRVGGPSAQAG